MFERLIRSGATLLAGILVIGASGETLGGTENAPVTAGPADIELRKSFRSSHRVSRKITRSDKPGSSVNYEGTSDAAGATLPRQLEAVATALGEQLQSDGTLHVPDIGGSDIVFQGSTTPILQTTSGRYLIIDRDRTIDPGVVDGITRRWPDFSIVQPPAGADLRNVIGSILDAAAYDSVLRSAPLVFGRGITIRITPDFVVLRSDRDLLAGETRAISVVDPANALPSELRELAGEHRVRIVELAPDGTPAGVDRAPLRTLAGRVTTMEAARLAPIIEKIASILGLSVVRDILLPAAVGEPGARADLGISGNGVAALVFEKTAPRHQEPLVGRGYMAIWLNTTADLPAAIGALLKRFTIPAIGPAVEFFRTPKPGSTPRFVISIPGWLAESGGRRLLITGATVPLLVRLYLTREGIDIFEYTIRAGR